MKAFLRNVAESLLERYGSNLNHLVVVFPGKRASLFLNQALAEASPTPVWAPRYKTISELFQQASPYTLCDPIEAVCRLYRSYAAHVPEPQTLDRFYSWGEVLLADFDDVDKHLVDAHRLFRNIYDIKALDDNSYITPEQEEALKSFFSNFSLESNTQLKDTFLELWNQMTPIYDDLKASMRADGLLYEGALQRDVVERLRSKSPTEEPSSAADIFADSTYVFVGFNVLNDVEEALFDELRSRGQALFYWDYDRFYLENHEAGYFIRRNLQRYGNALNADLFDHFLSPKDITIAVATSENVQARFAASWLEENITERENETAVVLANEQLLMPVLHSLPPSVNAVNVTMGVPVSDTPVYGFVCALLSLQGEGYDTERQRFRYVQLRAAANHPFSQLIGEDIWKRRAGSGADLLRYLQDCLTALGRHFTSDSFTDQLYAEALFQTFTAINRLLDLMAGDHPLLDVGDALLQRLLRSILQSQTTPFHGEPAIGLQVMGVLETRALDFRHLLMLSVGEGYLPKAVSDTSFIPFNLREAFGLTTVRHKIAVYAYYFYRLIQRAERITFVYNESNAGVRQNEISRFLRQLEAETDLPLRHVRLQADSRTEQPQPRVEAKTPDVMQRLVELFDNTGRKGRDRHPLSPTAMNTYNVCPMRFFYRYVRGIKIDPDPKDGLDPILFGNIFHKAAELLYRQLTSRGDLIRAEDLDPFIADDGLRLQPFVRKAFQQEFFEGGAEDYAGILQIAVRVLQTYLLLLLRHDRRLTPFRVVGLEVNRSITLHHPLSDGRTIEIDTGGIIDRLDQVSDPLVEGGSALRVLDYKTGGQPGTVAQLMNLFERPGQKEEYYFQTLLYASIVASQEQKAVTPCLFFVHRSNAADYSPKLTLARQPLHDVRTVADEFMDCVVELINDIFDFEKPFVQTNDYEACKHCNYRQLCGR